MLTLSVAVSSVSRVVVYTAAISGSKLPESDPVSPGVMLNSILIVDQLFTFTAGWIDASFLSEIPSNGNVT